MNDWRAGIRVALGVAVLGATRKALREAGADAEYIERWLTDATSADYDHLIGACIVALDGVAVILSVSVVTSAVMLLEDIFRHTGRGSG